MSVAKRHRKLGNKFWPTESLLWHERCYVFVLCYERDTFFRNGANALLSAPEVESAILTFRIFHFARSAGEMWAS